MLLLVVFVICTLFDSFSVFFFVISSCFYYNSSLACRLLFRFCRSLTVAMLLSIGTSVSCIHQTPTNPYLYEPFAWNITTQLFWIHLCIRAAQIWFVHVFIRYFSSQTWINTLLTFSGDVNGLHGYTSAVSSTNYWKLNFFFIQKLIINGFVLISWIFANYFEKQNLFHHFCFNFNLIVIVFDEIVIRFLWPFLNN